MRSKIRTVTASGCLALGFVSLLCPAPAVADEDMQNYLERESVREYIQEFSAEHGQNVNRITGLFANLNRQQSILDAISRPAERRLAWHEYRRIFMTSERVTSGRSFMREHAQLLQQAQDRYGVPAEIITAIIGVETFYGRITGSYGVLEALATLAFDYPPRSAFFKSEMDAFLLLSEGEGWDTLDIKGSYAGAMGMPQFIASSYKEYAVDFDKDGTRDLFTSHADIIGSVANYLSRHGWQEGAPVAAQWQAADDQKAEIDKLVRDKLKPAIDASTIKSMGFASTTLDPGTSSGELVSVMRLAAESDDEFWVGYRNFYAITRYNHSRLYAMAVYQLAEAIQAGA